MTPPFYSTAPLKMNHFEGSGEVTTVTKNTAHRRARQMLMTVGGPDAAEAGANSAGKRGWRPALPRFGDRGPLDSPHYESVILTDGVCDLVFAQ